MDWKKLKQNALSSVDTACGIAGRIPDVENENFFNTNFSYDKSVNPFPFLIDLIRRIRGYDYVIKLIARFIAYVLPTVETAVKAALIANLKNLLYCTIDPLLQRNNVLKDGITINVSDIDLLHTLNYCPLQTKTVLGQTNANKGHLFYFGCDGFKYPSQLVDAGDFNAFLWYVMNRSNKRVVWRGTSVGRNLWQSAEMFGISPKESFLYQKDLKERPTGDEPDTKENGIITLIKYAEGETPRNAIGEVCETAVPRINNDLIHVFIGNTTNTVGTDQKFVDAENSYQQSCDELTQLQNNLAKNQRKQQKIQREIEKNKDPKLFMVQKGTLEYLEKEIKKQQESIAKLQNVVYKKAQEYTDLKKSQVEPYENSDYRHIKTNYYYDKTLMRFNYDYIMSIKLFDSKVIAAQLIHNLLNMASSGNFQISYERKVIEEEVKKMLESVLERGDVAVSDCFFAFSNEEVNNFQRKVELQRARLYTANGEDNTTARIDVDNVLQNLDNIASNATQEEIQTIIEGSIMEVKKEIDGGIERKIDDKIQHAESWNFTKQLMENLLTVIVETICSPKVYLVYLINLRMLGQFDNHLNLEKFLQTKGELVAAIIESVANIWADFLLSEFVKLKSDIVKIIKDKLIGEKYEDYKRLLRQCLDCFKTHKEYLDFDIDDVDYADILQEESASDENNC